MSLHALPFLASLGFIFLRAFQQLNVVSYRYAWIVPTSLLMAVCEVFVVYNVAAYGFDWGLVTSVGFGSGIGAMLAMYIHKRFINDPRSTSKAGHTEVAPSKRTRKRRAKAEELSATS